jgi:predicted DNA-binding transcriptional regulator AlpA
MAVKLFNEAETAQALRVTRAALRRWRLERRGPRFVKLGRLVRYDEAELAEFVRRHTEGLSIRGTHTNN